MHFGDAVDTYEARAGVDLQAKIDVRLKRDTVMVDEVFDKNGKSKFVRTEKKAGEHIETSIGRIIFNDVLPNEHEYLNYELNKGRIKDLVVDIVERYPMSLVPDILDGLKARGFHNC